MSEIFSRRDSADYLHTEEDIALYFDACVEEDDGNGSLIRHALDVIARARGMARFANDTGLTHDGLAQALSPDGSPVFATVMIFIKALELRLHARTLSG